jgi:hypothetical protein
MVLSANDGRGLPLPAARSGSAYSDDALPGTRCGMAIPTSRVRSQVSRARVPRTVPTSRVSPARQG